MYSATSRGVRVTNDAVESKSITYSEYVFVAILTEHGLARCKRGFILSFVVCLALPYCFHIISYNGRLFFFLEKMVVHKVCVCVFYLKHFSF